MTLELSPQELRTLVNMASLALHVAEANQSEHLEETVESLAELSEKVFALAHENGQRDIVDFDKFAGHYMLSEEYSRESPYTQLVQEFEEDFFWGELAFSLAERDVKAKLGPNIDPVVLDQRLQDLEEHYMEVFSETGVDHLHLISAQPHQ